MAHINSTEVQTTEGPVTVTKTSTHRDYVAATGVQFADGTQVVLSWHMTEAAAAKYRQSTEAARLASYAGTKRGQEAQIIGLVVTTKLTGKDAKDATPEQISQAVADAKPAKIQSGITGNTCCCGCGEAIGTKSQYRPGHDARHAGRAARRLSQGRTEGLPADQLNAIVEALPTQALRLKALAMAHRLDAKAAAKAAKQAK